MLSKTRVGPESCACHAATGGDQAEHQLRIRSSLRPVLGELRRVVGVLAESQCRFSGVWKVSGVSGQRQSESHTVDPVNCEWGKEEESVLKCSVDYSTDSGLSVFLSRGLLSRCSARESRGQVVGTTSTSA